MKKNEFLKLQVNTAQEKIADVENEASPSFKKKTNAQQGKLQSLKNIGASKDFDEIIKTEQYLVAIELKEYVNGTSDYASQINAQKNLQTISENSEQVKNPARYKEVNMNLSNEKMRDSNGLPLDGARIAFKSHITRLSNEEKNRSTKLEKDIIKARKENIQIAQKIYIDRQYKALGIEPPTVKKSKEQKIIDALALSYLKENHISPDSEKGKQFIKAISNEAAKLQTEGKLPKPQILDSKAEPKPRTGEKSTPTPTRSTPNKKQDIER